MRHLCWIMLVTVSLVVTLTASPAYAWHCPSLAAEVKAVIAKAENKGGDTTQIQKAKELVDKGLNQHGAGKHDAAMNTLARAMRVAVHSVTQKKVGTSKKKSYGW